MAEIYTSEHWTVPEDTVPTNVYMGNYLSHRTV